MVCLELSFTGGLELGRHLGRLKPASRLLLRDGTACAILGDLPGLLTDIVCLITFDLGSLLDLGRGTLLGAAYRLIFILIHSTASSKLHQGILIHTTIIQLLSS